MFFKFYHIMVNIQCVYIYKLNHATHFKFILIFHIMLCSDYLMLLYTLKNKMKMNLSLKMAEMNLFVNCMHIY